MTYYASGNVKLERKRPDAERYLEFQAKQARGPLVMSDEDGEQLRNAVYALRDAAAASIWR